MLTQHAQVSDKSESAAHSPMQDLRELRGRDSFYRTLGMLPQHVIEEGGYQHQGQKGA